MPTSPSSSCRRRSKGCRTASSYRPILFAGLLKHWGQKGPAEIEPKRAWTFRQVRWLAHQHGIAHRDAGAAPVQPARAAAPAAGLRARRRHAEPLRVRAGVAPRVAGRRGCQRRRSAWPRCTAPLAPPRDAGRRVGQAVACKDLTAQALARWHLRRADRRARRPAVLGPRCSGHAGRLPARRPVVRRPRLGRGRDGPRRAYGASRARAGAAARELIRLKRGSVPSRRTVSFASAPRQPPLDQRQRGVSPCVEYSRWARGSRPHQEET